MPRKIKTIELIEKREPEEPEGKKIPAILLLKRDKLRLCANNSGENYEDF